MNFQHLPVNTLIGLCLVAVAITGCGGGGQPASDTASANAAQQTAPPLVPAPVSAPLGTLPSETSVTASSPYDAAAATNPSPGLATTAADTSSSISTTSAQIAADTTQASASIPTNEKPDPGSTTATGKPFEGLWTSDLNGQRRIAFINANGDYSGYAGNGNFMRGKWEIFGSTWRFNQDAALIQTPNGMGFSIALSGSGTFLPHTRFDGKWGLLGSQNTPMEYDYSIANSLAVSQADVEGAWTTKGTTLTIQADGAVSGNPNTAMTGECLLQGTITLAQPDTAKNLYAINLTSSNGPTNNCVPDSITPYTGYASITFINVGSATQPQYRRALALLMNNGGQSYVAGELMKE